MGDCVRVDTGALRSAAGQAAAGAHAAVPHTDQVAPCAPDCVSVAAATRFSAQLDLARRYTALANTAARSYGVTLDAGAAAYDAQESVSAAALGLGAAGAVVPVPPVAGVADAVGAVGAPGTVGAPGGEVPAAPRDVARLIETGRGGAGLAAWQAVHTSLRAEAAQLERAAQQLAAAIAEAQRGWDSPGAQAALARLRTLHSWYQEHAGFVSALAGQAGAHVQNFQRATADIPTYGQVLAAERELQTAVQANIAARGTRREAVVHAQQRVAGLYQASAAGFGAYTAAEAAPGPGPGTPAPPPGVTRDSPTVAPADGTGGSAIRKRDRSPSAAPAEPVQPGPGAAQNLNSPGPAWPPGDVAPADPDDPLLPTAALTAATVVPALVPGIIGGVVGGVGGVLGGLAGTGARALQGVQQAAAPMMSGLGQHPPGGAPQGGQPSSKVPESPGEPGGDDLGNDAGQTSPAGDAGAMSAPSPMTAAPAAAAPLTAPAAGAASGPAAATGAAIGAMGPMMPPPAAGRGGGSGPEHKQLYKDRKLTVAAPPNSEPVKNRREGRERDKSRG